MFERIEAAGITISDDCGRDAPEQVTYTNAQLAANTTDALRSVPERDRRVPAAHGRGGGGACAQDRGGRSRRERADDQTRTCGSSSRSRAGSGPASCRCSIAFRKESSVSSGPPRSSTGSVASSSRHTRRGGYGEAIERGVQNKARTIRMPVHVLERERKVTQAERQLTAALGARRPMTRSPSCPGSTPPRCGSCTPWPAR